MSKLTWTQQGQSSRVVLGEYVLETWIITASVHWRITDANEEYRNLYEGVTDSTESAQHAAEATLTEECQVYRVLFE